MANDTLADYRARMAECLLQAAHATDSITREALYEQAKMWEKLADQLYVNNLRPLQTPDGPVMQQQQQVQRKEPESET
jgi:hypothetical protein